MAQQRYLKNAPINEALVDFRVSLPKEFRPEVFGTLKESMKAQYPNVQEVRYMVAHFELAVGKQATAQAPTGGVQGFFFKTQDGLGIAQFRGDGFTYNRLRPYTRWEEILPEALRLWSIYVSVAQPSFVSRVALRYINHLKITLNSGDDLDRWFTALPAMPTGAPGGFSSFLSKVSTYDPESDLAANVTQALEGRVGQNEPAIILDIDVYKAGEVKTDTEALRTVLEGLRKMKNDIFFGTITEETARLFE